MKTHTVYPAEPYRVDALGSLGDASYMLLRQENFPNKYYEDEKLISADHDRMQVWDSEHTKRCFKEHTGTGDLGFENWARAASFDAVLAFLVDIFKESAIGVKWTGFRICGSVHRGSGYPVWHLSLFAKKPDSDTEVFSGLSAPNVSCGSPLDRLFT